MQETPLISFFHMWQFDSNLADVEPNWHQSIKINWNTCILTLFCICLDLNYELKDNFPRCRCWNSVWFTVSVSHVVWRPLAKCQEVWYNRFLGQAHPIKLSWMRPDALAPAKSWGSRLNLQYDVMAAPDPLKSNGADSIREKNPGKWEKFQINLQLEESGHSLGLMNDWVKSNIFLDLFHVPFLSCVSYNIALI